MHILWVEIAEREGVGRLMSEAIVTKHGAERMRGRIGIPKKAVQRLADIALSEGVRHSETTGALHRYISALYHKEKTANQIRLYGDKTYIFQGNKLITVIPTPNKYLKIIKRMLEKRSKNNE